MNPRRVIVISTQGRDSLLARESIMSGSMARSVGVDKQQSVWQSLIIIYPALSPFGQSSTRNGWAMVKISMMECDSCSTVC